MNVASPNRTPGIVLGDVSWETYLELRASESSRHVRMTYDEGVLLLMAPSKLHERVGELLGQFVVIWTDERNLPRQSCGSMTIQRQDLHKGFEPDKCYYLQNEASVRDREQLDLAVDPPPDLAIEIDVSASSVMRLPLYSAIGIPEVWRWEDESIQVLRIADDGTYSPVVESVALPGFPIAEAARLIEQRHTLDETAIGRAFRALIRSS